MTPKLSPSIFSTIKSLLVLLLVFGLFGCGGSKPRFEKDTIRMNLGNEPPSLDWHVTTDSTSFDVIFNIMSGLTQMNKDLKIIPALASSWEVSSDGTEYTFHLRDDIFWTDGKAVTAKDFVYSWRRLLDPKTGGSYASFLYDIENAYQINTGKENDLSKLGVNALDDKTFVVKLTRPAAYFLSMTATCPTFPLREDVLIKYGDKWTEPQNIVTNGPFKITKWQHEYKIVLNSNPSYFEGEPKVKVVKMFMVPEQSTAFALYENDELDYVDNRSFSTSDVERYLDSPRYKNLPLLRCSYVAFNVTKEPFTNAKVRRAFAMAVDKSVFPKILRRRESPISCWIPKGLPGYSDKTGIKFDPQKGRKLLSEAGYPDGKGLPKIELLYPNREDARLVVEAIQAQLKKNLGVRIELVNQEWKVYLARRRKDPPPMFRGAWGADFPDPESFMNIFTAKSGNNHTRWSSTKYDALLSEARAEQDETKRAEIYRQADELLCDQSVPVVPCYLATQNILTKPWVSGITFNALDIQTFKNASIEQSVVGGVD